MINKKGVTLFEMLLVMVVIGMILMVSANYLTQRTEQMKLDRAAAQIQQILNAGMAYYVNTGSWPSNLACLQGSGAGNCSVKYLPNTMINPWGRGYTTGTDTINGPFRVYTYAMARPARAMALAQTLMGMIPNGRLSTSPPSVLINGMDNTMGYLIDGSVNVPTEALNEKGYLNFAGIYHHGACVPVPDCPTGTTPQIFVAPAQISGSYSGAGNYATSITSFGAYARGPGAPNQVYNCYSIGNGAGYGQTCTEGGGGPPAAQYWRVCANVLTNRGDASTFGDSLWGASQVLMAVTRCSPDTGEPTGSRFNVYTQ